MSETPLFYQGNNVEETRGAVKGFQFPAELARVEEPSSGSALADGSVVEIGKAKSGELNPAKVLTPALALRVRAGLLSSPAQARVKDLIHWMDDPLKVPEWTATILELSKAEKREISTVLRFGAGGVPKDLSDVTVADLFLVEDKKLPKMGEKRQRFFYNVIQDREEDVEDVSVDEENLRSRLLELGILREPKFKKEDKMGPVYLLEDVEDDIWGTPDKKVEIDLWLYAEEYDLISRMINSGKVTEGEVNRLRNYFEGKVANVSFGLMERFSLAVANLA